MPVPNQKFRNDPVLAALGFDDSESVWPVLHRQPPEPVPAIAVPGCDGPLGYEVMSFLREERRWSARCNIKKAAGGLRRRSTAVRQRSSRRVAAAGAPASSPSASGEGGDGGGDGGDDDGEPDGGVGSPGDVRQVAPTALSLHPLAGTVPPATAAEYEALKADIERDGVLEPLSVVGDVVLDGRHRLRAALELGLEVVPVREVQLGEESELTFILRTALHRRHLSDDQRAVMAARMAMQLRRGGR